MRWTGVGLNCTQLAAQSTLGKVWRRAVVGLAPLVGHDPVLKPGSLFFAVEEGFDRHCVPLATTSALRLLALRWRQTGGPLGAHWQTAKSRGQPRVPRRVQGLPAGGSGAEGRAETPNGSLPRWCWGLARRLRRRYSGNARELEAVKQIRAHEATSQGQKWCVFILEA